MTPEAEMVHKSILRTGYDLVDRFHLLEAAAQVVRNEAADEREKHRPVVEFVASLECHCVKLDTCPHDIAKGLLRNLHTSPAKCMECGRWYSTVSYSKCPDCQRSALLLCSRTDLCAKAEGHDGLCGP